MQRAHSGCSTAESSPAVSLFFLHAAGGHPRWLWPTYGEGHAGVPHRRRASVARQGAGPHSRLEHLTRFLVECEFESVSEIPAHFCSLLCIPPPLGSLRSDMLPCKLSGLTNDSVQCMHCVMPTSPVFWCPCSGCTGRRTGSTRTGCATRSTRVRTKSS